MSKQLFSTSTRKVEDTPQDKLLSREDPPTPKQLIAKKLAAGFTPRVTDEQPLEFASVDRQYQTSLLPGSPEDPYKVGMDAQNWFSRTFNSTVKGVVTGGSRAIGFLGSIVGADPDLGAKLTHRYADAAMTIYDKPLNDSSSLSDMLFHQSTYESIISSVTEFGAGGRVANLALNSVAKGFMYAGRALADAGKMSGAVKVLGSGLEKTGSFIGKDHYFFTNAPAGLNQVTSKSIFGGVMQNVMEGVIMGNDLELAMEKDYANILNSPYHSDEVKAQIREEIHEAKRDLVLSNLINVGLNVLQFSAIMGKSINGSILARVNKKIGLVAPSEYVEEVLQAGLQESAKLSNQEDLEKTFGSDPILLDQLNKGVALSNKQLGITNSQEFTGIQDDGVPIKAEDLVASYTNAEEAQKILNNIDKSSIEVIFNHAFTKQATVEGFAGLVGGGPRWILTGGFTNFAKQIREEKANESKQAKFNDDVLGVFNAFKEQEFKNEVTIQEFISQLDAVTGMNTKDTEDSGFYKNVLQEYTAEQIALKAIREGNVESLVAVMNDTKKRLNEGVSSGTVTNEERAQVNSSIEKTLEFLKKHRNLNTHVNAQEITVQLGHLSAVNAAKKIVEKANESVRQSKTKPEEQPVKSEVATEVDENLPTESETPAESSPSPVVSLPNKKGEPRPQEELNELAEVIKNTYVDSLDKNSTKEEVIEVVIDDLVKRNFPVAFNGELIEEGESKEAIKEYLKENVTGNNLDDIFDSLTTIFGKKAAPVSTPSESTEDIVKSAAEAEKEPKKPAGPLSFFNTRKSDFYINTIKNSGIQDMGEVLDKYSEELLSSISNLKSIEAISKKAKEIKKEKNRVFLLDKINSTTNLSYLSTIYEHAEKQQNNLGNKIADIKNSTDEFLDTEEEISKMFQEITKLESLKLAAKAREKNVKLGIKTKNKSKERKATKITSTDLKQVLSEDNIDEADYLEPGEIVGTVESEAGLEEDSQEGVTKVDSEDVGEAAEEGFNDSAFDDDDDNVRASAENTTNAREVPPTELEKAKKSLSKEVADRILNTIETVSERFAQEKPAFEENSKKPGTAAHTYISSQKAEFIKQINAFIEAMQKVASPKEGSFYVPSKALITAAIQDVAGRELTDMEMTVLDSLLELYNEEAGQTFIDNSVSSKKVKPSEIKEGDAGFQGLGSMIKEAINSLEYTVASFKKAFNSLGHESNGESREFEEIKTGTKIVFRVKEMEDDDIILVRDPGLDEASQSTWANFVTNLKPVTVNGKVVFGYKGDRFQTVESMTPIIVEKEDGTVLGHVHTGEWITKPRTDVTSEEIEEQVKENNAFRKSITSSIDQATKTANGVILEREENIKISEEGYIVGTALKESENYRPVGTQLSFDDRIEYDIVDSTTTSGLRNTNDPNVAVGDGLMNNPNKSYDGGLVALIPVEGTQYRQAKLLRTDKVAKKEFASIVRLFTEYLVGNPKNERENTRKAFILTKMTDFFGVLQDNLSEEERKNLQNKKASIGPSQIEWLLSHFINTKDTVQTGTTYSSLRISVEPFKSGNDPNYPYNDSLRAKFTLGEVQYTVEYHFGGVLIEDAKISKKRRSYAIATDKDGRPRVTKTNINTLKTEAVSFDEVASFLRDILNEKITSTNESGTINSYPYFNVKIDSIASSKKKKDTLIPTLNTVDRIDEIGLTNGNYIEEVVYKRVSTTIDRPKKTTNGTYNYHVNTIITMNVDKGVSEAEKVVNKNKKQAKKDDLLNKDLIEKENTLTLYKNSKVKLETYFNQLKSVFQSNTKVPGAVLHYFGKEKSVKQLENSVSKWYKENPKSFRLTILNSVMQLGVSVPNINTAIENFNDFLETGKINEYILGLFEEGLTNLNKEIDKVSDEIKNLNPQSTVRESKEKPKDDSTSFNIDMDFMQNLDFLMGTEDATLVEENSLQSTQTDTEAGINQEKNVEAPKNPTSEKSTEGLNDKEILLTTELSEKYSGNELNTLVSLSKNENVSFEQFKNFITHLKTC